MLESLAPNDVRGFTRPTSKEVDKSVSDVYRSHLDASLCTLTYIYIYFYVSHIHSVYKYIPIRDGSDAVVLRPDTRGP